MSDNSWQYYGFSFLMKKSTGNPFQKRRMHFNILAKNYTKETLDSVIEARNYATEKFENEKIIGLAFKNNNVFIEFIKNVISLCSHHIEDIASIIIGLTIAVTLFQNINTIQRYNFKELIVDMVLPIAVAITVLCVLIKKGIQIFKYYKDVYKKIKVIYHAKYKEHNVGYLKTFIKKVHKNAHHEGMFYLYPGTLLLACLHYIYRNDKS